MRRLVLLAALLTPACQTLPSVTKQASHGPSWAVDESPSFAAHDGPPDGAPAPKVAVTKHVPSAFPTVAPEPVTTEMVLTALCAAVVGLAYRWLRKL